MDLSQNPPGPLYWFMSPSHVHKRIVLWLSIFIMAIFSTSVFSQSKIAGQIKDSNGTPLPFANVVLLAARDSAFAKGAITNPEGKFIIENVQPGKFFIMGTSVGFKKNTHPAFEIGDGENFELPPLVLATEAVQLNEVVVETERPLFEQQIDKLVINVQNSITAAGNTVLEVLQKSPGIIVNRQNNTIIMNGKSGVRVMINEKIMQLPPDVVVQMLDGMNAATVEKIELITTPPAKYDAEGNSGIIHIVMKENSDFGTNATLGLTLGYKWAETWGGNFNINHRTGKAAYFFDYSVLSDHNRHIMNMYRAAYVDGFKRELKDSSNRIYTAVVQNLRAGAEWKIRKNTTLGLLFTAYRRKWDMDAFTNDINHVRADSTVITDMDIREINIWQNATAGMRWQIQPDPENKITFDVDYLYSRNSNPSGYSNNQFIKESFSNESEQIDLEKITPIEIVVGKADYECSLSPFITLETGIKAVLTNLNNDVRVERLKNNTWNVDSLFTSDSHLEEKIGAAYLSASWKNKMEVQMSGGMRYEFTSTYISTPEQKGIVNRKYGYFFPSFFLKKDISKEKDIQFSYSRRVTRPTFRDIAPFVFFWGPNTFSAGNTALWPAISDGLRLGYHYKGWIISLQYNHSKNEISFFQPELQEGSQNLIYRSQNLRYLNSLSLSNSWSFNVARWWEVQTNLIGQYQKAQTAHLENNATLAVYNLNVSVTNMLAFPKNISVEVSGYYQSKSVFGISQFMPLGSLNAGIQKKFHNNGTLRLSMDDILYTSFWKVNTDVSEINLHSRIKYDWHNQYIRMTYTRNFGNNKLKAVQLQSGSEDERRRIND